MALILIALFIGLPIAEIYVIIKVGSLIGVVPTIALLILDGVIGAAIVRHQGRAAWRRFNAALAERRFPSTEVADGVLIAVGGAFVLAPGFITDAIGLFLLLPPTRTLVRRALWRYLGRRFRVVERVGVWGFPGTSQGAQRGFGEQPFDVEGSAEEVSHNGGSSRRRPDDRELPPLPPS